MSEESRVMSQTSKSQESNSIQESGVKSCESEVNLIILFYCIIKVMSPNLKRQES